MDPRSDGCRTVRPPHLIAVVYIYIYLYRDLRHRRYRISSLCHHLHHQLITDATPPLPRLPRLVHSNSSLWMRVAQHSRPIDYVYDYVWVGGGAGGDRVVGVRSGTW
ncbi:hypothetical protein QJS10_CPB20g00584 [Acorus calamus]|uniref:Uncharacterized protein n=1 Tax=Acorus calamus TaxID=4465 RepID=A0AAV9CD44_ACOCL|nr:hypothetical protein QJS10_CPB20g00584 [Acorus calamus]